MVENVFLGFDAEADTCDELGWLTRQKCNLELADGMILQGFAFGATQSVSGEVVLSGINHRPLICRTDPGLYLPARGELRHSRDGAER